MRGYKLSSLKRRFCILAIFNLVTTTLFINTTTGYATDFEYGNIDEDRSGSITIHKLETGSLDSSLKESEKPNEGNPQNADKKHADPISNVLFNAYKLPNVDLKTPEGWDFISRIDKISPDTCSSYGVPSPRITLKPKTPGADSKTISLDLYLPDSSSYTDENGIAILDRLEVGAYLVCEMPYDKEVGDSKPRNENDETVTVVKRSAPFIVTIPRPHSDVNNDNDKGWIYDVHAYPKNTVIPFPKKRIIENKKVTGVEDGVTYEISSTIPQLLEEQNFRFFSIMDQMPKAAIDAKVQEVIIRSRDNNRRIEVLNRRDFDYTTEYNVEQHFLSVNLMPDGLKKLKNNPNEQIVVRLTVKINTADIPGDFKVENTGYVALDVLKGPISSSTFTPKTPVIPGGPGKDPELIDDDPDLTPITLTHTNKSAILWGRMALRKYDVSDDSKFLKGAVFQVFEAEDQDACIAVADDNLADDLELSVKFNEDEATPIEFPSSDLNDDSKQTDFTTDEEGKIVFPPLFINAADAKAPKGEGSVDIDLTEEVDFEGEVIRCYVIREIKAPAGFALPAEDKRDFAVTVRAEEPQEDNYLKIPNTRVAVPNLPLTGASGRLLLMSIGGALVLGSFGLILIIRRHSLQK